MTGVAPTSFTCSGIVGQYGACVMHFRRRDVDTVVAPVASGYSFAELRDPGRGGVAREIRVDRFLAGGLGVLRRRKIRLTSREVDDVEPRAAKPLRLGRRLERGRSRNRCETLCKHL